MYKIVKSIFSLLILILPVVSFAKSPNAFYSPSEMGPYKIGFIETNVTLFNNRSAPVRVWYPSTDNNAAGTYTLVLPPGPNLNIKPAFEAMKNASVAMGKFPMILDIHPAVAGSTPAALGNFPINELLASHGFVVASFLRSGDIPCLSSINDPRLLIDVMLNKSANNGGSTLGGVDFLNRIDADKIGTQGISGGGFATISLLSGVSGNPALNVPAIPADPRVKAAVLDEPSPNIVPACGLGNPEWASINVPYLLVEGSPVIGPAQIPFFNGTTNALPRYDVHIPNTVHLSLQLGNCSLAEQGREISLTRQIAANPNAILVDPLLVNATLAVDNARNLAFTNWNGDVTLSAAIGGGRQYCNKLGVDSQLLSTDANHDGLTDVPPFGCTGPLANVCATFVQPTQVTDEQVRKYVNTYTIAFFKVNLEKDPRYKHFLTEDWTSEQFPGLTLTVVK